MAVCAACGHTTEVAFRFCPECGAAAVDRPGGREVRKTVTVVFCDVTGSTALGDRLDPEALRGLLASYFERMRAVVERHGGSVEKFIGDAVMAVFGIPTVHEDDALRAVRAAVEMRGALPDLGLRGRIGVQTGEVVAGTLERLATGDAVNVAARLEQAAEPGQVLIGEPTYRLVQDRVDARPIEPLALKGKSELVGAWLLEAVLPDAPRRELSTPMIGRGRQRRSLEAAYRSAVEDRACHLVTVLGAAGVGKSRLVGEFLGNAHAAVVRGRCLSYGEGITYWPVVEILKQLDCRPADPGAAETIAGVLGEGPEAGIAEQVAWAVRKTLEEAAQKQPLICVIDDIHWAESALLDLIEHVADLSRDAPLLLLCMARPELLDRRPGWGGGKLNAQTMLLEPLSLDETDELMDRLGAVPVELREQIREAAGGNPLFVEEMLAMIRDGDEGAIRVPPSIHALLAARLDQLDPSERVVLERGAVEGKVFHRGSVAALAPDEPQISNRLVGLVRKDLVRPDVAVLPGDDAYRFRHLLIRDAAYESLPKAARADLHERFADWLSEHGADLVELDEILGYHLELAIHYRQELGQPVSPDVRSRAASRLAAAGYRAYLRQDWPAAAAVLARASLVHDSQTIDLPLEVSAIWATIISGDLRGARDRAQALTDHAIRLSDRPAELTGMIEASLIQLSLTPDDHSPLDRLVKQALQEFEGSSGAALYSTWNAVSELANLAGHYDDQLRALDKSLEYAQLSGMGHLVAVLGPPMAASRLWGSTPASSILAWFDDPQRVYASRTPRPWELILRSVPLAMLGRPEEATAAFASAIRTLEDRGATFLVAMSTAQSGALVHALSGDLTGAVRLGRRGCGVLEEAGERGMLSTALAYLARNLAGLGELDEAEIQARKALNYGSADDSATQTMARGALSQVSLARGRIDEAEHEARLAVKAVLSTQSPWFQADALFDLAAALNAAGHTEQAADAYTDAIRRYDLKEHRVGSARAREALAALQRARP
jgi:class 3 adenylate cyclase/tetratricopeptide (TPR) repeat protein